MKVELDNNQLDLLLCGLDEIIDAAEAENGATGDQDIHESNDARIAEAEALYEYLSKYGERKGEQFVVSEGIAFELVDSIPYGYEIWNIGPHMVDGYLPLCRLKAVQPFEGGREIETDTLKAIKCEGAQVILAAVSYGPDTPEEMEKYIAKYGKTGRNTRAVRRMEVALPYMRQLKWN